MADFSKPEWQTVPPRVYTQLTGAPGFEIYVESDSITPLYVRASTVTDGVGREFVEAEVRGVQNSGSVLDTSTLTNAFNSAI